MCQVWNIRRVRLDLSAKLPERLTRRRRYVWLVVAPVEQNIINYRCDRNSGHSVTTQFLCSNHTESHHLVSHQKCLIVGRNVKLS